jgi:hypothetical protein
MKIVSNKVLDERKQKNTLRCTKHSENRTALQIMRDYQAWWNGKANIIPIICYCNTVRPSHCNFCYRHYVSAYIPPRPFPSTYQHLLTSALRRHFTNINIGILRCEVMQLTIFKYYWLCGLYSQTVCCRLR